MNFDDIKDKLREVFVNIWSQIQESSAWIELTEKFQNLSSTMQKAVLAGLGVLMGLIVLAIPYSFFSASQDSVAEFEDKRQLVRELYRVARTVKTLPPLPGNPGDLQVLVNGRLQSSRLQPDQIVSVTPLEDAAQISGIPKSLEKNGVVVSLKKLNLRQVVDIGHDLQVLHPSTKMTGVEVKANRDDGHYFDVVYKILSVTLPPEPVAKPNAGGKKTRGRSGSAKDADNNDGE